MFYKRTFLLNNIVIKEPFFRIKTQNWHANPEIWTPHACHGTGLSHDMRGVLKFQNTKLTCKSGDLDPPPHVMGQVCPMTCGGVWNFKVRNWHADPEIWTPPPHVMGQVCPMTCGGVWNSKIQNWHANPEIWTPPACHGTGLSHDMRGGLKFQSPKLTCKSGDLDPPRMSWDRSVPWHAGGVWNFKVRNWHADPEIWTPPACHGTGLSHDMRGGLKFQDPKLTCKSGDLDPPRMSWDRSVPWHAGGFEISKSKTDMQIRRFGPPPHVMGQVCPMTCGWFFCAKRKNFRKPNFWHASPEIWPPPPPRHVMGQACPMTCGGGPNLRICMSVLKNACF